MTSDYAFTQDELNISDGVGYPNAYAELCRHRRAGLYSHGPPFTFMPYCLQQQQWFQKRHKKAMTEALEKIKADTMLPCKSKPPYEGGSDDKGKGGGGEDGGDRRKLLSYAEDMIWRRVLAPSGDSSSCSYLSFGNQPSLSQVIKDDGREYLDVYEPNQYHRKHDMLVLRFQILHSLGIAVYIVGNLLEQPNSKEFRGLWVVVADDDNLKRDVTTKLLQNLVLKSRRTEPGLIA